MSPDIPSARPSASGTGVVVAIATYRRPAGLRRVLDSMADAVKCDLPVTVVILDNEPAVSTETLVHSFAKDAKFDLRYVAVPQPGISAARNAAILEASGAEYLAFIDDDEIVPSGWLAEMLYGLQTFDADVVAGPVETVFEGATPSWMKSGNFSFDRPKRRSGTSMQWCASNNTLMRRSVLDMVAGGFDPRYSSTGGGDTHFFLRASIAGANIVWYQSAPVVEFVSAERANLAWLLKRAYRGGGVRSRVELDVYGMGWKLLVRTAKGFAGLAVSPFALVSGALRRDRNEIATGLQRAAAGAGTLAGLAGFRYHEYKRDP